MAIEWNMLIDKISQAHDWSYQESEGNRANGSPYRFDQGNGDNGSSLWLHDMGAKITAEGICPLKVRRILKEHNIPFTEL